MRRIFIAINLPEGIKNKLAAYQAKWPDLPCRWTKKDNLHITLEFLGYIRDEDMEDVFRHAKELAAKYEPFEIGLNKICYGPPEKMPPRMVWIIGPKMEGLGISPHITLGRIKTWEWKAIEPEERPEVSENINITFEVNSIEVMESQLKRGGPAYTILESCAFTS
jgi:RNA 2',3'-cyclic 3'-phosphodiesterase